MNAFQELFTREREFDVSTEIDPIGHCLCDIEITVHEITKEMENLDVRKSQGPDSVSN